MSPSNTSDGRRRSISVGRPAIEGLLAGGAISTATFLGLLDVVRVASAPWFLLLAVAAPVAGGLVAGYRSRERPGVAIVLGAAIGFCLGVVPAILGIALEGVGLLGSDAEWLFLVAAIAVTPTAIVVGGLGGLAGHVAWRLRSGVDAGSGPTTDDRDTGPEPTTDAKDAGPEPATNARDAGPEE